MELQTGLRMREYRRKWLAVRLSIGLVVAIFAVAVVIGVRNQTRSAPSLAIDSISPPILRATSDAPAIDGHHSQATFAVMKATEGQSRGYLTTPQELKHIMQEAEAGIEPYHSAVEVVLEWAASDWDYELRSEAICINADRPRWLDNQRGAPRLYARALAYQLTGEQHYAKETSDILEQIMTKVETISLDSNQCRLAFGWGTPELVASADLIEDYWIDRTCTGPTSTVYSDTQIGEDNCKRLFQNWLVKNPYYVVSYSATAQSNWGAAATNTTAYIADYLWDRTDVELIHRMPQQVNGGKELQLTPSEAFALANRLMFDRMNGYGVDYESSSSCDFLDGDQQLGNAFPVKSQITETGIVTEDARRQEYCNIVTYNGKYQNYPQLHLGHNIQQCELMLRRGSSTCFDNVDDSDKPEYTYFDRRGERKTTHLRRGRGSIERAIKAIIVDSNTEWRHDSALMVAYHYYYAKHTLPGFEEWAAQLDSPAACEQDICFGLLTHGFAADEIPAEVPASTASWVAARSVDALSLLYTDTIEMTNHVFNNR